jgi:hypothetical protein
VSDSAGGDEGEIIIELHSPSKATGRANEGEREIIMPRPASDRFGTETIWWDIDLEH